MRLGIDIGGTFTDFVLYDPNKKGIYFGKSLTTYPDPTDGIFNGLDEMKEKFNLKLSTLNDIVHGTTLVTNAIIERKGAPSAFITTKGFEDVLEIGRELRYDIYDLNLTMPKPLIDRRNRFGVKERVDTHGNVLEGLQIADLKSISQHIHDKKIESVGVCLLNSFANNDHENQIGDYLAEHHPEVTYSLSSAIMPEIREYERSSATAMNAYVQPITSSYLRRLESRLTDGGFKGNLNIMISSGSLTTLEGAIKSPIQLLESGPAGGSMAGVYFGKQFKEDNLLCFDMGGTTAKASLIYHGKPEITNHFEAGRVKRFKKGSGLPVRIPVIDMIEIGAGGGSIARVNKLGLLTVGPDSASSSPGPACYNLGGEFPTVTDCDLFLGYLNPDYFLGGTMDLSVKAAEDAIRIHLAEPMGISVAEAAMGVHRIVNQNMANAARVHILERGMDPRHFNMIAFGGAGPVHAFGVAKLLLAEKLYIPVGAGVTSALGFLTSPVAFEKLHSHVELLNNLKWNDINSFLLDMENEGRAFLEKSKVDPNEIIIERIVDMRYEGQGHEITIHLPYGQLNEMAISEIENRFIKEYEFRYNRSIEDVDIQMVTWRMVVKSKAPHIDVVQKDIKESNDRIAYKGTRRVYFEATGFMDCPIYDRYGFQSGETIDGPAIIEERESSTIVGLNSRITLDEFKNIIITLK